MANENFYKDFDLRYPETAILAKRCYAGEIGSFYIPVLTPYQSSSQVNSDKQMLKASNLMNADNNITINKSIVSNTIDLKIPNYLRYGDNVFEAGTKFIVVFLGGDINQPRIIGGDW